MQADPAISTAHARPLTAAVFSPRIYAVIVAMSLPTAMITPPILAWQPKRTPLPLPRDDR